MILNEGLLSIHTSPNIKQYRLVICAECWRLNAFWFIQDVSIELNHATPRSPAKTRYIQTYRHNLKLFQQYFLDLRMVISKDHVELSKFHGSVPEESAGNEYEHLKIAEEQLNRISSNHHHSSLMASRSHKWSCSLDTSWNKKFVIWGGNEFSRRVSVFSILLRINYKSLDGFTIIIPFHSEHLSSIG